MKKYTNIMLVPSLRCDGYANIQLLTVAIGDSLSDSIQCGRARGGSDYLDK